MLHEKKSVPDALNAIEDVLKIFLDEEEFLMREDVNERSITHSLATHLQNSAFFNDWQIDCEYNRLGKREVNKPFVKKILDLPIDNNVSSDDTKAKTVFPDIIVHQRGDEKENFIVLEVKKTDRSIEFDKIKLTAYVQQLKYQLGICVELGPRKATMRWTTDGNFLAEAEKTVTI
ncbi:hypothetical protein KBC79_00875 [Candidatus Woesebacteria bacterium]|nr:hypothetical protein [Candidatus Woesebacteria bacterium]